MGTWSKIDWYCSDCNEYWMTTENCSPCARLNCWCHCSCRKGCKTEFNAEEMPLAVPKCHQCGHSLGESSEFCSHFPNRSQAV